ncbi:response regulator [Humitalea sp. 24SJ18S-53]|uniref:response regulator n=1 Tax=Humitalea sp. 24SJ18S-53 TaxID=3422307 RepID=UPI003D67D7D7
MPYPGCTNSPSSLRGRRVLVVEDEALVAMLVEDALIDAGAEVIGPVRSVNEALASLVRDRPDAAVLDLNLDGVSSSPVADALAAAGVPFVVATGYGVDGMPPGHAGVPVLAKPYDPSALTAALMGLWPKG